MNKKNFGSNEAHYEKLTVKGDDLYWGDKKIKLEDWSRMEKITFVAIILAFVTALLTDDMKSAAWEEAKELACEIHTFDYCQITGNNTKSN